MMIFGLKSRNHRENNTDTIRLRLRSIILGIKRDGWGTIGGSKRVEYEEGLGGG